jgi:predicted nucleic acid-binding Zn ribbon protein
MIESAKSGRASCRVCRKKIEKGELRFGEEAPNAFDPDGGSSYFWHHLACAAQKKPNELKQALAAFTGEIPNRAEIDALLQAAPPDFPYAERAPTGRSKCLACGTAIEKDALRVAIEREVDTGAFVTKGAGYLHLACAKGHVNDPELLGKLKAHSKLDPMVFAEVEKAFA